MKKNISINLQGMIFHIEEDGYEVLRNYLDSIKIYFSGYAGHQEIIADIESRMAELFYASLTPAKQVITLEDVQALIKKMGSVNDFAQQDKDEDEVVAPKMIGNTTSGSYSSASGGKTYSSSKKLYRDGNQKVLGGVAAGLANYLQIDPIWIRISLIALLFLSAGFIVIAYIICWIALPVSYDTPASGYTSDTTTRRLFRDPDNKSLGGVCSGLGQYLGIDVTIMRLLFLIAFFFFGTGLLLYLLLWLILPEAKTPAQKAQMQGKPLTLSGIENALKNSLQPDGVNQEESPLVRLILLPVRLISQILVVLSRLLGPFLRVLLVIVRVFAGVLLLILAFAGMVSLVSLLGISLGFWQEANFINMNGLPENFFFPDFPLFGKIAGFLTGFLPALFLILLGLALLSKRFYLRATVGWSMFALWLVSGFVFLLSIVNYHKNFEEDGVFTSERTFPAANYQTVWLDANKLKSGFNNDLNLGIESYNGSEIRLIQEFSAEGRSEEDAVKNAQMIQYRAVMKDSMLTLDNGFTYKPNAIFRDQHLALTLRLPEGKQYRISYDLARMLPESNFDLNYSNEQISKHAWTIKSNVFSCVTCTAADSAEVNDRSHFSSETTLNEEAGFLKSPSEFGSSTRKLDVSGFRKVTVVGPFYVKITNGTAFKVNARGNANDLQEMRYELDGTELKLYPKKSGFSLGRKTLDPIYISIEMPDLTEVSLVGASTAEISGFKPNELVINQTGATKAYVNTNARTLEVNLTGASKAILEGTTENLQADVIGGCELNATKLTATSATLDIIGGSEAHVNVLRSLSGDVTGGSELTYSGNPEEIKVNETGGSDVNRREN